MKNTNTNDEGSGSEQSDIEQKNEVALVTDEQLEAAGLVKVTAFVRSKQSEVAARKAKQREKEAAEGIKQLNLKANIEHHDLLKQIAASIQTANEEQKKLLKQIIADMNNKTNVTSPVTIPNTSPTPTPTVVTSPKKVTGFKGKLIMLLKYLITQLTR